MANRALTGVLLVGGRSRRFGSPKALAQFGGETFADRAWRLLGEACGERFAAGRADGLPFATIDDAVEGGGPLAGIVAALRAGRHELAVVIPVDTPLLDVGALHALADACRDVAVSQAGPLPCAVAKHALPVLEEALARGDLALRAAFERLDTAVVELDPALLANVNEPGDLEQLGSDDDASGRAVVKDPRMSGFFRAGADAYDDFMGRYSVRLAPLFADFAGVRAGQRVLDVGAGTGALTAELVRRGADTAAAEPSPEFCVALRERFPGLEVEQAPAEQLPFDDGRFDAALAQLVVAFMSDAPAAMRELARVARTVAICMWSVEEMQMFAAINRTASAIGAERGETGARRYRTREELVELLAPLGPVETADLDATASYADFDEFWRALGRQVGPAGAWLAALDEDRRARARDELFRQLGSPAGAFELTGRCYAARVSTDARSAPVPTSVTSTSSSRSTNST